MSAPIRGQRRVGTPSLVLPGDPDGAGWWATGGGRYVTFPSPPTRHPAETGLSVRYVGGKQWGGEVRWGRSSYHHTQRMNPLAQARHIAPLVTADVLSCWCPLDAPCHADTLCDLVGRLRSGDLVPGLVATPNVCGGALRIECTDWSVVMVADEITRFGEYDDWTSEEAVYALAADLEVDPDLVEVAARVGGAL